MLMIFIRAQTNGAPAEANGNQAVLHKHHLFSCNFGLSIKKNTRSAEVVPGAHLRTPCVFDVASIDEEIARLCHTHFTVEAIGI
jgi:hypothetical protein